MKFWYKLSEASAWKETMEQLGRETKVSLFKDSENIRKDFEENETSDWWPLEGEYKDTVDAQRHLYILLGNELYEEVNGL